MKFKSLLTVLFLALFTCPALADFYFFNTCFADYKLVIKMPNGTTDVKNISNAGTGGSYWNAILDYRIKSVTYDLQDDTGATIFSGKADESQYLVAVDDGGKVRVVNAGFYGGNAKPAGSILMTNLPGSVSVDLLGDSGVGAIRGISLSNNFDPKKMVKLGTSESKWNMAVKVDGKVETADSGLHPGYYGMVWRNSAGQIKYLELGTISK